MPSSRRPTPAIIPRNRRAPQADEARRHAPPASQRPATFAAVDPAAGVTSSLGRMALG
jgi:hypothetical protein